MDQDVKFIISFQNRIAFKSTLNLIDPKLQRPKKKGPK